MASDSSELDELLRLWLAPDVRRILDHRIARSFRSHRRFSLGIASPRFPSTTTEVSMKRCNACEQVFEDKFSFCPIDATPLNDLAAAVVGEGQRSAVRGRRLVDSSAFATQKKLVEMFPAACKGEFRVTMIDSTSLLQRLAKELRFLIVQLKQIWPAVKRDPIGFGRRAFVAGSQQLRRTLSARDIARKRA